MNPAKKPEKQAKGERAQRKMASRGGLPPNTRGAFGKEPVHIPPALPVEGHRFLLSERLLLEVSGEIHAYRLQTDVYIHEQKLHGMQSARMWAMTSKQDIFLALLVVGVLQRAQDGAEAVGVEGFLSQFEEWANKRAKLTGTRVRNRVPLPTELDDWGDEAFVARAIWPIRKYICTKLDNRWPLVDGDVLALVRVEAKGVAELRGRLISEFRRKYRLSSDHTLQDIEEAVDASIALLKTNTSWLVSYPAGQANVLAFCRSQLRKRVADKMPRFVGVSLGDVAVIHGGEDDCCGHKTVRVPVSSREARRRATPQEAVQGPTGCSIAAVASLLDRNESSVRQALSRVEAAQGTTAPRRAGPRSDLRLDEAWLRRLKEELERTPSRRRTKK